MQLTSRFLHTVSAVVAVCACAADAAARQVLVNFDIYPDGSLVQTGDQFTVQWAGVGVVFSDGGGGAPGPAGNPCSYSRPNHAAAGGLIVATFVDPCSGKPSATDFAGTRQDWCWVPGEGIDMYAYDADGNLLDHQFNSGGGNLVTFSFPKPVIATLKMYHLGQGIDDFVFNTPAPVKDVCPADVTDNGVTNIDDLLGVINAWGACGLGFCPADTNCDGSVNIDDLLAVINAWGPCP